MSMTKPDDDCDARAELSRIRGITDELLEIPHDTNAKLAVLIPVDGSGQVSGNPVVACCHETTDGEVRVWCRTKFQARYALLEPLSE